MPSNNEIHNHISNYLDKKKREFITESFGYTSYTAPHTMFSIGNDLPELMLKLNPPTLKVWLRCMSLLKRNHDPVMACTIIIKHEYFKDLVGRTNYYKAIKELVENEFLINTLRKSVYIVNINYANKLYKPKPDL